MKVIAVALLALSVSGSSFAGVVQSGFRQMVSGASSIEVIRSATASGSSQVIFSTSDPKKIQEISDAFDFIDPSPSTSADGEEIITLTCFCVPEYFVTFGGLVGGSKSFGLKHSVSAVLPPEPLGVDYVTDLKLAKRSGKKLKKLIQKWEKRANQSPETRPTSRPVSA